MVESQINVAHIDPFRAHRVRPNARPSLVRKLSHKCHADNMASWIAINIGVDAEEDELGDVDSGLLSDFTAAGGHHGFADFYETAWQRMLSLAGFVRAANE